MQTLTQERIQYLLEVMGKQEAEAAFKNQARAITESSTAAARHSEAIKANARAQDAAVASVQKQVVAQRALAQATTATTQATSTAAKGAAAFTNTAKGSAIVIGQFANAATGLIPSMNGAGAAIVRASSVIGGIAQAAGAGPAGLIAGGAVAALGLLSLAFKSNKESAEEAAAELADYVAELKAVNDAAAEAAANSPVGIARRREAERQRENTERQRNALLGLFDSSSGASPIGYGTGYDLGKDDKGRTFASKEEQAEYLRRKEEEAGGDKTRRGGTKPVGIPFVNYEDAEGSVRYAAPPTAAERRQGDISTAGGRAELAGAEDLIRALEKQYELAKKKAEVGKALQFNDDAIAQAAAAVAVKEDLAFEKRMAAVHALRDAKRSASEEELRQFEERDRAAQANGAAMRATYEETTSVISNGFAGMAASIARGEKATAKAVLTSIGSEIVGRGTGNLLDAIFRAANPLSAATTGAPAQIPLALAQIAFGASLAGAGAALPGGGGAGAGGGSGRPISPTVVSGSTDTGAKNPQPQVVNNFYSPAVVAPSADDGRRSQRAYEEAKRQGRLP